MTKRIRIENADSSNFGVVVQIWDRGYPEVLTDTMVREIPLNNPFQLTDESVYLTSTRYILIKEMPPIT